MCGIAGLVDRAGVGADALRETVDRMTATLRHRGPDDGGVWADPAAGVALGHRRLAILDLSPAGAQPMTSASARYVVTFNGEVYNFRSLRRELEGLGHAFRGGSDTEVLLAAVEQWGLRPALERFNGMFAFALWDRKERILSLARDRLGEKPLYYGTAGRAFVFASELKALRAHRSFDAAVDRDALAAFLRLNCVPAPHSIYRGVRKLPPGTVLELRPDAPAGEPVAYWSAREVAERGAAHPLDAIPEEAVDALDELLRDAVRIRMEADVPLGAFLSGGIDSSTVVSLMQAQSTRPVRTFSIGTHDARFNEARDAAAVARHLGTDHTELYVTADEAMAVIPRLPSLYDEPFSDSSQIPTFLVAELARRHVTVGLSGDGGDELFGGYNRHVWTQAVVGRTGRLPRAVRERAARALLRPSAEAWDRFAERALPAKARPRLLGDKVGKLASLLRLDGPEAMYRSLTSHWTDPASVVLGGDEPAHAGGRPRLADFTQMMMYLDLVTYLPDDILVKVDRATMGVGLEGRIPLLDHRIVELAWRIPLALKIEAPRGLALRAGRGKWLLRQVLHRYVPPALVERPKTGFGVPIASWLRGPLKEWARSLIEPSRLRNDGFFDPAPIETKWNQFVDGSRDWGYDLWDVLMFQAWLDAQRTSVAVAS